MRFARFLLTLVLMASASGACSLMSGGDSAPVYRPSPAAPVMANQPEREAAPVPPVRQARTFEMLPSRLKLSPLGYSLPDATLDSRGAVRALVLPVSLGAHIPQWGDSLVAYHVFGAPRSGGEGRPPAAAGRLHKWSQGLFHLDASVFPVLIDVTTDEGILGGTPVPERAGRLHEFVDEVVSHWATRTNLASFDNDGPDGYPMSGDDDGRLDLVVLTVETEGTPGILRVDLEKKIRVGKDGRLEARVGPVYLLALPRAGEMARTNLGSTTMLLRALGLQGEEMYFPASYPRAISTLARIRLGWVAAGWAGRSGRYEVPDGRAVVLPVVDVHDNRALWLAERDGSVLYLSRVVRKQSGHFATVTYEIMQAGDTDRLVPLTEAGGEMGPRARIQWDPGGEPVVFLALSPDAAQQDEVP